MRIISHTTQDVINMGIVHEDGYADLLKFHGNSLKDSDNAVVVSTDGTFSNKLGT